MTERITIPTLIFHSVRKGKGEEDIFAVEPSKFDEIMDLISQRFGTFDVRQLTSPSPPKATGRKVLVTFDDGYKDNYENTLPILEKYGIKALFFLLPKYLGQQNLWNTQARAILSHLSPDQVEALLECGHIIGSHGLTHHSLTKFDDQKVLEELNQSKSMLQEMFRVEVNCFAYPYGRVNPYVARLAKKVYPYSFTDNKGSIDWQDTNFSQIRREYTWPHNTLQEIEELIIRFGYYNNNPYQLER